MSNSSNKRLFTLAALFNWLVGLALMLDAAQLMELMSVSPLPTEFTFVRILGGLVFTFGIGYYWAGNDLRVNAPVIRLGVIGKLFVVAIGLFETLTGQVSWQFLILVSGDLIFALLFVHALRQMPSIPP